MKINTQLADCSCPTEDKIDAKYVAEGVAI